MKDNMFNELLESVKEMGAIVAGDKKPSRVTEYPEPVMGAIRKKIGRSQDKFAYLIGGQP